MQTTHKKGLTVKDLVTTGIFSAFFLAFALVAGSRHYRSKLVNSLSYLILSLGGGHQRLCGPLRQREIRHRQAHHFLLGRITADSVYVLAHLHRPRHDEGRAHHPGRGHG